MTGRPDKGAPRNGGSADLPFYWLALFLAAAVAVLGFVVLVSGWMMGVAACLRCRLGG